MKYLTLEEQVKQMYQYKDSIGEIIFDWLEATYYLIVCYPMTILFFIVSLYLVHLCLLSGDLVLLFVSGIVACSGYMIDSRRHLMS